MITIKDFTDYDFKYNINDLKVIKKNGKFVVCIVDKQGNPVDDGVILSITPKKNIEIYAAGDITITDFDGKLTAQR